MAQSAKYAGAAANVDSADNAWRDVSNATGSSSSTNAAVGIGLEAGGVVYLQLENSGVLGNSKSSYSISSAGEYTFGGSTDKWSATLTPAVVNASGFGVNVWYYEFDAIPPIETDKLKLTSYGFNIKTGSTINGVEVKLYAKESGVRLKLLCVAYAKVTVYYTEGSTGANKAVSMMSMF